MSLTDSKSFDYVTTAIICSLKQDLEDMGQIILLAKHCCVQSCSDSPKCKKNKYPDLVNYVDSSILLTGNQTFSATKISSSWKTSKAFHILPFLMKSLLVDYLLGIFFPFLKFNYWITAWATHPFFPEAHKVMLCIKSWFQDWNSSTWSTYFNAIRLIVSMHLLPPGIPSKYMTSKVCLFHFGSRMNT